MLIEGIDLVALLLRGLSFVLLLQAAGLALFMMMFASHLAAMPALSITLRKVLVSSAVAALLLVMAQQLLQAGRMSGEWQGVLDLRLQQQAWLSSSGAATLLRVLGLLLLMTDLRGAWLGALLICGSFLLMGHTTQAQRSLLSPLLAVHLVIAAGWFGALLPLYLASRRESPRYAAGLTAEFSRHAFWSVPLIAVAGMAMALLLLPNWQALLQPYGLLLLAKVSGFGLLMALATLNKWRWGTRLSAGELEVHQAFRRTVLAEYVLISIILLITAVMTGWYSPD